MSQIIVAILTNKETRTKEQINQLAYSTAVNTPAWFG